MGNIVIYCRYIYYPGCIWRKAEGKTMGKKFRKEFIGFCAVEAVYFAIFANYSYQSVWLKEAGISSSQIGFMVSVASVVGMIACFVWGTVSDRLGSAKKVFVLVVSASAILYALLPFVGKGGTGAAGILFVYITLIYIFKQSGTSMMDSWVIGATSHRGIPYGSIRMWGSVGYAVMSMVWGAVAGVYLGVEFVFYSMIPLMIIFNMICFRQPAELRAEEKKTADGISSEKEKAGVLKSLLGNKAYVVYMVYAFGLNIYIGVSIVFMPYILEAANCQAEQVGIVTGFRAVIETCAMFAGTKLARRLPLRYIMILPGLFFGLEHLLYQFAGNMGNMLGIMALSGIAGGLSYSIGPSYIFEIVPKEVKSRAQSLNAMNLTFIGIIGTAVGGYVIDHKGVNFLTTGCGILIMSLTGIFVISLIKKRRA